MKCPVCNKEFKNIQSHFIKSKCEKHIEFLQQQIKIVKNNFNNTKSYKEIESEIIFGRNFILKIMKLNPNKEKRICNLRKSLAKTKKVKRIRISQEKQNEIISYFHSTLSVSKISKIINCDERTIIKIFIKVFGEQKTKERFKKTKYLSSKLISKKNLIEFKNPEVYKKIIYLFNSDKSLKEIGDACGVFPASIANIWRRVFGEEEYQKRIRVIKSKKQYSGTSSHSGSKNEVLCYELLFKEFGDLVQHHNYNLVYKLEIDIVIFNKKIAINWDGISHRKPIYGQKTFQITTKHDKIKNDTLLKLGWRHISVIDDGKYNPEFVYEKVQQILSLIEQDWAGKKKI